MSRLILLGLTLFVLSSNAFAWSGLCEKVASNAKHPEYAQALTLLAKHMEYSEEQLCNHPRILDIYGDNKTLFNPETHKPEPHVWMTLHYSEYSCQYFFRQADWKLTQSNCYNTW